MYLKIVLLFCNKWRVNRSRSRWPRLFLIIGRDIYLLINKTCINTRSNSFLFPYLSFVYHLNISTTWLMTDIFQWTDFGISSPIIFLVENLNVTTLSLIVTFYVVYFGLFTPKLFFIYYFYVPSTRFVANLFEWSNFSCNCLFVLWYIRKWYL